MWLLILAGICFLYSGAVYMTGSGTGFFVIWFLIGIFFLFNWMMRKFEIWKRIPIWIHSVYLAMAWVGVICIGISQILVASAFIDQSPNDLDKIIVLGAQVRENGPSVVLKYRLDKAADYLQDNPDTVCIVSGGQGSNEPTSEAEGMRDYLVNICGIEASRILLEDQSLNTTQNLEYSAKLLDKGSDRVGIVTNNFHVFRAVNLAKKQGYKNVYGIPADSHPVYLPNNMFREFFGIVKDFIFN